MCMLWCNQIQQINKYHHYQYYYNWYHYHKYYQSYINYLFFLVITIITINIILVKTSSIISISVSHKNFINFLYIQLTNKSINMEVDKQLKQITKMKICKIIISCINNWPLTSIENIIYLVEP